MHNATSRTADARLYYYWHAHMEKPLVHRLLAGLLLWQSGADGISPYCYQHLPGAPRSPYDDFDGWDPQQADEHGRAYRDHMATYPARDGVVPTVQWRGMADGMTDLRYLLTLDDAIAQASRSGNPETQRTVNEAEKSRASLAGSVSWLEVDLLSETTPAPCPSVSSESLTGMRRAVIESIASLQLGNSGGHL